MDFLTFPFVVSVISSLVTGVFAFIVLRRYWQKRRPHLRAWGIGLLMYFLGTFSQVVLAITWSEFFFALWYWTGALMVAAWLGQGTVYLLVRRGSIARNLEMALWLVGIMTLPWTLFYTQMDSSVWYVGADMTQLYRQIMGEEVRGTVRFFSPVMNTWGTLALVGGAIWSARLFRKKQIMRNRMVGNWLIAAGGLLPALGGLFIRLGDPSFKYFGEMAGALLIFAGFWIATSVPDTIRQQKSERAERMAARTGSTAAASNEQGTD